MDGVEWIRLKYDLVYDDLFQFSSITPFPKISPQKMWCRLETDIGEVLKSLMCIVQFLIPNQTLRNFTEKSAVVSLLPHC